MGFSTLAVIALVLLIVGAASWTLGGRNKSRREQVVGKILIALGVLSLLAVVGLIYVLGRIL